MSKCISAIIFFLTIVYLFLNAEIIYSPRKLKDSTTNPFLYSDSGFAGTWTSLELSKYFKNKSGQCSLKFFQKASDFSSLFSFILTDGSEPSDPFYFLHAIQANYTTNLITIEDHFFLLIESKEREKCEGKITLWVNEKINGTIESEECGIKFEVSVQSVDSDKLQTPIVSYSFIVTCASVVLIFAYSKHAQDCLSSDTVSRKTSINFLIFQQSIDLYYTLLHLYLAMTYYKAFDYLLLAAFMNFAVYLVIHGKLMMQVWKSHNPSIMQEGLDSIRRKYSLFESFNVIVITSFIPLILFFKHISIFVIIVSHTFLPQIIHSAIYGYKNSIKNSVIAMVTVSRLLLLLYLFGCPANFLTIPPNLTDCSIFSAYLVIQACVLSLQNKNPRFFLPRLCRPKIYSYFREPEEEKVLEKSECIICMTFLNLGGQENAEVVNFARTMHTPCRHMFHEDCLMNWMSVKMECPTCRSSLPLIEE